MTNHADSSPLMLSVSGCRGIFGRSITPHLAAAYAEAFGQYLVDRLRADSTHGHAPARPLVVLGRDGRAGGEVLARAAAAGLQGSGCDVFDLGVAMTPTVGVEVDAREADAGLVITASHNPQIWNGLKPVLRTPGSAGPDAAAPDAETAHRIIDLFRRRLAADGSQAGLPCGTDIGGFDALADPEDALGFGSEVRHVERVRDALRQIGFHDDRRGMSVRVVLDSVNASGAPGAARLLGGRLIQHLGAGRSGLFPHDPEPTEANLLGLCDAVRQGVRGQHADVGMAQDPDADRLALVDERGVYIGEEYTLVLAATAVLTTPGAFHDYNPVVCTNLSTSRMIDDVAAKHGARVVRTAVGEANVVNAMRRERAVFGGEGNGGVIWPRVTLIRDSLSAMGLVLALMTRTGQRLSELVAEIPRYEIVKRKIDLPDRAALEPALKAVARAFDGHRLDTQDGLRADLEAERAWVHVRGSNTEPILRVIAEAPDRAGADSVAEQAERAVLSAM